MRLGVIGAESTVDIVRRAIGRLSDVEADYHCCEHYEEAAEQAAALQKQGGVDAILFSGPTNYAYAHNRVAPLIPWGFLPHSRSALQQALLTAANTYRSDLKAVSVDRYSPALLHEVLVRSGIPDAQVFTPSADDPEQPGCEERLIAFHRACREEHGVSVCLTSMEHVLPVLQREGIPCVRIVPAEEVVLEEIFRLQTLVLAAKENHGRLAVIVVQFDYVFDSEQNLPVREWEKMMYRTRFTERIYTIAQRMDAAVFEQGTERFYITATRKALFDAFLRTGEHEALLKFGHRSPEYGVWVGIGIGDTMLEAKSRANMAINHSLSDRAGSSYLVESEAGTAGPVRGMSAPEETLFDFARRSRISVQALRRLYRAAKEQNWVVTAESLAGALQITHRSANRMLAHLEAAGCVTEVGHQSAGRGRPARKLRVTLPDALE